MMEKDNPHLAHGIESHPSVREALGTEPPVKEIRTYMRDGTTITEEYERLNPDGTVTKTVSIGDRRDGLKHFGVYKMDKSGIVRKVDNADQGNYTSMGTNVSSNKYAWEDELKQIVAEQRAQKLRRSRENMTSQYSNPYDKAEQLKQQLTQLTPTQKAAVFGKYKDSLIDYGTKKLETILQRKLNEEKLNKKYPLTDDQKDQLITYGVKKLHKLLKKNLDEDKFFSQNYQFDQEPQNSHTREGDIHNSTSNPVSFVFQPSNETNPTENETGKFQQDNKNCNEVRPVSFVIRPEYESKAYSGSETSQNKKESIFDRYKKFWKQHFNGDKTREEIAPSTDSHYKKKIDEIESLEETLEKELKQCFKDDKSNEKRRSDKQRKNLKEEKQKKVSYDTDDDPDLFEEDEVMDEKRKGKYKVVTEMFDDDEIFDYGLKSLRKLIKKSYSQSKNEEHNKTSRKDKIESRDQTQREYTDKNSVSTEHRKQSVPDDSAVKLHVREINMKPDHGRTVSQQYVQAKTQNSNAETQQNERKSVDFDSFLSWVEELTDQHLNTKTQSSQLNEKTLKDKRDVLYEMQPPVDSQTNTRTESSEGNENKSFGFNSLLSNIKEILLQQTGRQPLQQNENFKVQKSIPHQSRPQAGTNKNPEYESSEEKEPKLVDVESLISRIQKVMSQPSSPGTGSSQQNSNEKTSDSYKIHSQSGDRTTNGNSGAQRIELSNNGSISFKIHPQSNAKINMESHTSPGVHKMNNSTSSQSKEGFFPWWFEQSSESGLLNEQFMKEPQKPLIEDSFMKAPFLSDSGFQQILPGNMFSNALLK